jgi:hypothetical protein
MSTRYVLVNRALPVTTSRSVKLYCGAAFQSARVFATDLRMISSAFG